MRLTTNEPSARPISFDSELADERLSFFQGLLWLSVGTWLVFPLWLFMEINPTPSLVFGVLRTEFLHFLPGLLGLIASAVAHRVAVPPQGSDRSERRRRLVSTILAGMFVLASVGKLYLLWLLFGPVAGVGLGNGSWMWLPIAWLLPMVIFLGQRQRPPSSLPSVILGVLIALHASFAQLLTGSDAVLPAGLGSLPFLLVLFTVECGFLGGSLLAATVVLSKKYGPMNDPQRMTAT